MHAYANPTRFLAIAKPLTPWLLGVGQWWAKHYFDLLQCELGPTKLRFRKGGTFHVTFATGDQPASAALIAVGGFMSLAARLRRRSPAPATSAETPASDGAGEKAPAGAIA